MSKIYVASSWRNEYQPEVVEALKGANHEVYDFRHPGDGGNGFRWNDVDADWQKWTVDDYRTGLRHPVAERGFRRDMDAMRWADICVLVLPCGRSAHAEAGWMKGAGKKVLVFIPHLEEAELMYKLFDTVCGSMDELLAVLG